MIDKSDEKYSRKDLEREIEIHKSLKSEYIVKLIQHFEDNENHYLLTEYCPDGELTKFLLQQTIKEETIVEFAFQAILALEYLHNEAKVSHGDIKLSNILLSGSQIVFILLFRNSVILASLPPCLVKPTSTNEIKSFLAL